MQKAFNDFYLRAFALRRCLNPKLLFNFDVLKYRAFIGILTKMFKGDMSVFIDTLKEREAST